MKFLGLQITRAKALPLSPISTRGGGWFPLIRESFMGAWQRNVEVNQADVLSNPIVYACIRLIASDIGKLHINLVQQDAQTGIWTKTESAAFSPVLRKPNRYSTRNQFFEQWVFSRLIHGNTYVLKQRDNRGIVVALYVLDPTRVSALVSPDGSVFYQLNADSLAGVADSVVVPAREIIHDRLTALYHPLFGISPLASCGLSAVEGLRIQENSALLFANGSHPGGILTTPQSISKEEAQKYQEMWQQNYGGQNAGTVAVLGHGFEYKQMAVTAHDSQMVEQWESTAKAICSSFGVPAFKVGVGPAPAYNNVEALNQAYYSDCLQAPIENIESLLDEGLELPKPYGTEFDLDDLLRMDSASRVDAASKAVRAGMSPNEARSRYYDLGPVPGGDTPFMQQQDWPLSLLAQRTAADMAGAAPKPASATATEPDDDDDKAKVFMVALKKELGLVHA